MRMPIALRRLALVAATTSLLATLPFTTPAHAAVGDVKNVDPISTANSGNATVSFDVTANYLALPEPTVRFVRSADASDVITVDEDNVSVVGQRVTVTASFLRRNPGAWNIEVSGYVAGQQDQRVDSCVSCFTVHAQNPAITPFSKTVGGGATSVGLVVNGTNFTDDYYCSNGSCAGEPTITVSGTGVTLIGHDANGADVKATATTILKRINVAAGATPGPRDVTVTNTDGKSATCTGCLVVAAAPTLTAVSPASLARGASNRTVTLTGTNFAADATVTIAVPNTTDQTNNRVSITNKVVDSPTQITLTVSVEDNASIVLGDRSITVRNPGDGGMVTRTDLFDVNAKPTVTGVSYLANTSVNRYGQGAVNRTLRVNGTGFQPGAVVTFATPAGITVHSTTVVDATKIDLALTLNQVGANPPSAAANPVKVTNPDGGVSGTTDFTVFDGPRLDSVSPSSRGRGETVNLVLKGDDFSTAGVTVEIEDATVTSATVVDAQTINVTATIGSGLNIAGPSDVRVTNNNDKGSFLCDDVCFTVVNLQVNSITPSNVLNEGSPTFTISGSGFNSDAVATLRKTGTGAGEIADVTGTTTSVNGAGTSMTVTFPIDGVAPGGWSVRVTNPTSNPGVGVCTCALTIVAPQPDITSLDRPALGEGADDELFTVSGTNFAPGARLSFSNAGVTVVPGSVVVTPTKITALVDVTSTADANEVAPNAVKTVTVTNTDGASDDHAFEVNPGPSANSLDITTRARGTTTVITLTGNDLAANPTLLIPGTGVTASVGNRTKDGAGVLPDDDDEVQFTVTVAPDATLGGRVVSVRNPDGGQATCAAAASCTLTITAAPTVTSVSPAKAAAGKTTVVNVLGTGFQTGPTVDAGPGVTATATYISGTQLSVSLNVASGAALGNRSLKVTNTDGGNATLADAYKVFTVPGVPTNVTATAGEGEATVSWTAPATDGNDPLTSYRVIADPGPVTFTTADASTTTATVTGLTNGTAYKFSVVATNAAGDSAPSAQSTAVTPATEPGAPTAVTAVAGYHQATVSWTAPVSNGGSPITGYTVRSIPGDITKSVAGNVTQAVVDGLTGGVAYTFVVSATNAVGTGPDSLESNAIAPTTLPGAPRVVAGTPDNGSVTVTWSAPESDGGTPVIDYTVTSDPENKQVTVTGTTATVSGLTNGTAYTFVVTARNANGTGPASDSSAPVTPRTTPGQPTGVTALPTNGGADVSWTAPASDGGSAITAYVVKASPGDKTIEVPGNELTANVTGLTNGTAYTFTVTAKNAAGSGPESAASAPVTPRTVPGAPATASATRNNGSATVTWTAPAGDGGSAITGYVITSTPGDKLVEVNATTFSVVIDGLDNGTSYTFAVRARNVAGTGPSATTNAVVPATVPGAPTAVAGTPADSAVNVAWAAPASNGGEVITGYVVTASPGDHTVTVGGDALGATVSGLTNGTPYTFTVKAVNAVGTGAASAPSDAVTPRTVAGAPTGVTATFGDTKVTVSWTAPASNGGAPITGYTVTSTPGGKTATVAGDVLTAVVEGLTNGTEYTFAVVATNAAGNSAVGTSNAVTPAGVPLAPTGVTATAGHAAASVTWTAANGNGRPVTGYTVTASPGGASQTVTGTSATFNGLSNGVLYTFSVKATNAVGDGPASVSNAVRPTWVTSMATAATVKIVSGGTSVVSGRLSRSDGVGLQGGTISIYRKVAPATTFSFVRNVTTGTNGTWRTSFTLTKHTRFKMVFGGAPGFDPVTGAERVTQVAHRISAAYAFSGRTVTVSGSVSPNSAGRTVYLRHRRSDGTYAVVATKTIAANGTYKLSKTLARGTYYLTMYIPKSATNSANQTPIRTTRIS